MGFSLRSRWLKLLCLSMCYSGLGLDTVHRAAVPACCRLLSACTMLYHAVAHAHHEQLHVW
jgi:hypothetical protein